MNKKDAFAKPGEVTFFPVEINPELCIGCNKCVEVCQCDVFAANPEKGGPPLILFPQECWQEGSCVDVCEQEGAIKWKRLPNQRVRCRDKQTGEDFFV